MSMTSFSRHVRQRQLWYGAPHSPSRCETESIVGSCVVFHKYKMIQYIYIFFVINYNI